LADITFKKKKNFGSGDSGHSLFSQFYLLDWKKCGFPKHNSGRPQKRFRSLKL